MKLIGLDVGGTHVTAAEVTWEAKGLQAHAPAREPVNSQGSADAILTAWSKAVRDVADPQSVNAIGFAMPGPFDYPRGISLIKGLSKYDALYGMDVGAALRERLALRPDQPIVFENDANCYVLGEWQAGAARGGKRVIGMTLGTGFGSGFLVDGAIVSEGEGIPPDATLGFIPYRGGIAEDFISRRGILKSFQEDGGDPALDVADLAKLAMGGDKRCKQVFTEFGAILGEVVGPVVAAFRCDVLVIGGTISRANNLFRSPFEAKLGTGVNVVISELRDTAGLLGAAELARRAADAIA